MARIPEDLEARTRHGAAAGNAANSDISRAAIEAQLGSHGYRTLLAAGAGRSGRSDISEHIEEILAVEGTTTPR